MTVCYLAVMEGYSLRKRFGCVRRFKEEDHER